MPMEPFILYPAIDLRNGKAVRLYQGDYGKETVYGDPLELARSFYSQGAKWIHLVDLDGAKEGYPVQKEVILSIVESLPIPVQVGGGIRTLFDMEEYLQKGVARLILGTKAVEDPAFIRAALSHYGEKIAIGIDARDGRVKTRGWLAEGGVEATLLAQQLAEWGAETFIFTDIRRDGTLTGPNLPATIALAEATGKRVIASGGISSMADLVRLKEHQGKGITGAIVGKALYSGMVPLKEALEILEGSERDAGETNYTLS